MDDNGPAHLTRRKSIAGPFMRPGQAVSPTDKPHPLASSAGPSGSGVAPPLSRANTYGGWFPSFFGRSTGNLTQSGNQLKQSNPIPIQPNSRSILTASMSDAASPGSSLGDSRNSLMSSEGFARAGVSAGSPPPLARRLSESGTFLRPTSGTEAAAAISATSPRGNSILETDIRQGPIETDLFWLVLRDIGE